MLLSVKPSVNRDGQNRYRHVDGQCTLGAPSRAAGGGEEDDRRYDDGQAVGERSFVFRLSAKLADSCGRPTAGLRNTNFNASSGRRLTPLQPLSQYWQGFWPTKSNGRLLQALVVSQLPSAEMAESLYSLDRERMPGSRRARWTAWVRDRLAPIIRTCPFLRLLGELTLQR